MTTPVSASARGFTLVEIMLASMLLAVALFTVVGTISTLHTTRNTTDDYREARRILDDVMQRVLSARWNELNDRTATGNPYLWNRPVNGSTPWLEDNDAEDLYLGAANDTSIPTARRLPYTSTLDGLRVYVEYHRAISALNPDSGQVIGTLSGGLMQADITRDSQRARVLVNPANYLSNDPLGNDGPKRPQTLLNQVGVVTVIGTYSTLPEFTVPTGVQPTLLPVNATVASVAGTDPNASHLGPTDPVAIRVVISWIDRLRRDSTPPGRQFIEFTTARKP